MDLALTVAERVTMRPAVDQRGGHLRDRPADDLGRLTAAELSGDVEAPRRHRGVEPLAASA